MRELTKFFSNKENKIEVKLMVPRSHEKGSNNVITLYLTTEIILKTLFWKQRLLTSQVNILKNKFPLDIPSLEQQTNAHSNGMRVWRLSWWRHQMETFSALLVICAENSPAVNSPHKGQRRGALMLPLICVWINGWISNRKAGDVRRYLAHCDVTVMVT